MRAAPSTWFKLTHGITELTSNDVTSAGASNADGTGPDTNPTHLDKNGDGLNAASAVVEVKHDVGQLTSHGCPQTVHISNVPYPPGCFSNVPYLFIVTCY